LRSCLLQVLHLVSLLWVFFPSPVKGLTHLYRAIHIVADVMTTAGNISTWTRFREPGTSA
jgi:hypothetical protein